MKVKMDLFAIDENISNCIDDVLALGDFFVASLDSLLVTFLLNTVLWYYAFRGPYIHNTSFEIVSSWHKWANANQEK